MIDSMPKVITISNGNLIVFPNLSSIANNNDNDGISSE